MGVQRFESLRVSPSVHPGSELYSRLVSKADFTMSTRSKGELQRYTSTFPFYFMTWVTGCRRQSDQICSRHGCHRSDADNVIFPRHGILLCEGVKSLNKKLELTTNRPCMRQALRAALSSVKDAISEDLVHVSDPNAAAEMKALTGTALTEKILALQTPVQHHHTH